MSRRVLKGQADGMLGSTLLSLHRTSGMVQPQHFQGSLYLSSTPRRLVLAEGHVYQKLIGENAPACEMTHLESDHPDCNPGPEEQEILQRAQPHTRQHIHPQPRITSPGQRLHLCKSPAPLRPTRGKRMREEGVQSRESKAGLHTNLQNPLFMCDPPIYHFRIPKV